MSRALLTAALGFARLGGAVSELRPLRAWLDSWRAAGVVVDGMARLGFGVALTRHGDGGTPWRALFYPAGFLHISGAGSAWGSTPWEAGAAGGVVRARATSIAGPRRPPCDVERPFME